MIQDGYMGMNKTIASYLNMMANENTRCDVCSFLDPCCFTDETCCFHERPELPDDLLVSLERLRVYQQRFPGRNICFFVDDDESGRRMKTLIVIFGMVDKHHITWFHFMNFIDAGNHAGSFTNQFCPYE